MGVRGELRQKASGSEKIIGLDSPKFTIGRGDDNSLGLTEMVISRNHAEIIRIGNDFVLKDNSSTNGSFVNDLRVSEQILQDGDLIRFGKGGPEFSFSIVEEQVSIVGPDRLNRTTTENLIDSLAGNLQFSMSDVRDEANLRCVLADAYLKKSRLTEALDVISKYTNPDVVAALPPDYRITVLLCVGTVQMCLKNYSGAIETIQRCMTLFDETGNTTRIGEAQLVLGRSMIGIDEVLSARDHLHRANLAARQADNSRIRAEAHLLIGKIDWKENDLDGARYNWTRAGKLAEGTTDDILRARVKVQQAFVLYAESSLNEAVEAYQAAIDEAKRIGNIRLLVKAYAGLSRVLTRLGSWAVTEQLLETRLQLAREHQLDKAEAIALTDLAEIRQLQGNIGAAWNVVQQAVERQGTTVYPRTQRILGRILTTRVQLKDAVAAFVSGLDAAQKKGDLEEQVLINLELALVFLEALDIANAERRCNAAQSITSLDPALSLMARALYTRGRIEAATGKHVEANRAFTQSLSLFQTIGDPYRAAQCHTSIGSLRATMDRHESARAHLEEAQRMFAKLGAAVDLRVVEGLLRSPIFMAVQASMAKTIPEGSTLRVPVTARLSMAKTQSTTKKDKPMRVLVAVNNDNLADTLERGLRVENYLVDRAADGRAALDRTTGGALYDMLLLDALLEFKSGFDICRELRKKNIEMPIILLGSRQGVEDKIEALQSGADDFLSKRNFVFEELMAKMEALLR